MKSVRDRQAEGREPLAQDAGIGRVAVRSDNKPALLFITQVPGYRFVRREL